MKNEVEEMDAFAKSRLRLRGHEEKLTTGQKVEIAGLLYLIVGGAISAICYLFGIEWVANLWLTPIIGFMAIGIVIGPVSAGIDLIEHGEKTAGETTIIVWAVFIVIVAMYYRG